MSTGELTVESASTPAGDARIFRLAKRLNLALSGSVDAVEPPLLQCGQPPAFAAAFRLGSEGEVVDVGSGLWSVKRVSSDGDHQVLCVFNLTGVPRSFTPGDHLCSAPLQFVSGDVDTYRNPEYRLVCRLRPFRDVWLGAVTGVARA
ncbi:hypothetical protein [Parasphingorhabdus pacifica]